MSDTNPAGMPKECYAVSDPASLRVAREKARQAFDSFRPSGMMAYGGFYQKVFAACEAYAAALSGEPPAAPTTPEERLRQLEDDLENELPEPQGAYQTYIERVRLLKYWLAELGVPPAAPTAATPRPEDDQGIREAARRCEFNNDSAASVIRQRREALYAAISDWHRRTLGGEPPKQDDGAIFDNKGPSHV